MKITSRSLCKSAILTVGFLSLLACRTMQGETPAAPPVFSHPLSIDNPYHPFVENRVKVHVIQQGHTEEIVLEVHGTDRRSFLLPDGVTEVDCATLSEIEFEDGELVEISLNYFAQADDGTLYYFGETVDIFEDGMLAGHEGSWLVGGPTLPTDPAETASADYPAVFMPGHPEEGDIFKPEDLFPLVDETVEIIKTEKTVVTPAGQFKDVIKVKETTQLSDEIEYKWYGPGIGVIKVAGRGEIVHLLEWTDAADTESREALVMALMEEILAEDSEE